MKELLQSAVIGRSAFANQLREMLPRIAAVDAPVFLSGPTGVGKTYLAQIIHQLSPRREKPFIKMNCTNIPPTLLESELFGHVKGAFTGAYTDRIGVFQAADGGTVFFDEIAEIPPEVQAKLLTVIESKQFSPVGSTEVITVNVRIIAATNKPIGSALKNGEMRSDLFYRLNTIPIDIPPLSLRPEDIPQIVATFQRQLEKKYHHQLTIPEKTMRWLQELIWPGNLREIKHFLERVIVNKVAVLTPGIARQFLDTYGEDAPLTIKKIVPLKSAVASYIKQVVAMTETKSHAARLLEIDIKTLNKYLNHEDSSAQKTGDN